MSLAIVVQVWGSDSAGAWYFGNTALGPCAGKQATATERVQVPTCQMHEPASATAKCPYMRIYTGHGQKYLDCGVGVEDFGARRAGPKALGFGACSALLFPPASAYSISQLAYISIRSAWLFWV